MLDAGLPYCVLCVCRCVGIYLVFMYLFGIKLTSNFVVRFSGLVDIKTDTYYLLPHDKTRQDTDLKPMTLIFGHIQNETRSRKHMNMITCNFSLVALNKSEMWSHTRCN